MSRVEIIGLCFSYGRDPVLDGVSLDVADGSLTAVIGPSGCGKTTLLRLLAGVERPTSGLITIGSTPVTGPGFVPAHRRKVGMVPQESALFGHLTVARNVGLGLPRRVASSVARVEELLSLAGLEALGDRLPRELSGGQQQRVALLRALAPRPRLVLLDEPFAALDTEVRVRLRRSVRELLAAEGATAILVTHDREETLTTADRVAVMLDGRIAQAGTPEEVYRHPGSRRVATMLGEATFLPVLTGSDGRVDTALGPVRVAGPSSGGEVVVRPEQVVLTGGGADGVPGRVVSVEFSGASRRAVVDVGGTCVVAAVPGAVDLTSAAVGVRLDGVSQVLPVAR